MIAFGKKMIVFSKVIVFGAEYDRFGIAGLLAPAKKLAGKPAASRIVAPAKFRFSTLDIFRLEAGR